MKHPIDIKEIETPTAGMWFEAIVGTVMIFALLFAMLLFLPDRAPVEDLSEGVPKPVIVSR